MLNVWVCIASGPSLTAEDVNWCRSQGWQLATCNMGYQIAPDCHLFYAMDDNWWRTYGDDCLNTLNDSCLIYCGDKAYSEWHKLRFVDRDGNRQGKYSDKPGLVYSGKESGHNLINIVGWQKPDLVILLGYDHQHTSGKAHWHADYPQGWRNGEIDQQSVDYANIAATVPFPVLNCTRETALTAFPTLPLEDMPEWITSGQITQLYSQNVRKG